MRAIEATAHTPQPVATLARRDSLPPPTYAAVRRQPEIRDRRREALYSPITADLPNRGSALGSSIPSSIAGTSRVCSPFSSDLRKVTKVATSPISGPMHRTARRSWRAWAPSPWPPGRRSTPGVLPLARRLAGRPPPAPLPPRFSLDTVPPGCGMLRSVSAWAGPALPA